MFSHGLGRPVSFMFGAVAVFHLVGRAPVFVEVLLISMCNMPFP